MEFLIPGIVIEELDGKKRAQGEVDRITGRDVASCAQDASNWLLDRLRERKETGSGIVRGQAYTESCQPAGNWKACSHGASLPLEFTGTLGVLTRDIGI